MGADQSNNIKTPFKAPRNEYDPRLLNIAAVVPFVRANSSTRMQMAGSQMGQSLTVHGSTLPRTMSGVMRELGNYTFAIRMPADGIIRAVIPLYRASNGYGAIKESPISHMIYQDMDTGELGYLELPTYHRLDKHFGFRYVYRINPTTLIGKGLEKGTIIADSPNKTADGDYKLGVELNVAFMSIPAIIEDGCKLSRSAAKKFTTTAFDQRVSKWKKDWYPLNLFGNDTTFKAFPDIGERVGPDGLLLCLRRYDEDTALVDMTPEALRTPDYFYDHTMYVHPNAKVIDIRVYYDGTKKPILPAGMDEQVHKYIKSSETCYENIFSEYKKYQKELTRLNQRMIPSREIQMHLVRALADKGHTPDGRLVRNYSLAPIEGYMIEFTLEYDLVPTVGFKLTGLHGDKTIICDVDEDENMPIDIDGNRVEIVRDGDSIFKRMNLGAVYEPTLNAAARDHVCRLREMMGLPRKNPTKEQVMAVIHSASQESINTVYQHLVDFIRDVAPVHYEALNDPESPVVPVDYLVSVFVDGLYLLKPTDDDLDFEEMMAVIYDKYPPVEGPVKYYLRNGRELVTRSNVLVGSMYYLLLNKTAGDWSAVASAKLQHFGIPCRVTAEDKYRNPALQNPIRLWAEYEVHMYAAVFGGQVMADILDQSNNPVVHKEVIKTIINAAQPTNIECLVDRRKHPLGNARPLQHVRHIKACSGIHLYRRDDPYNDSYVLPD